MDDLFGSLAGVVLNMEGFCYTAAEIIDNFCAVFREGIGIESRHRDIGCLQSGDLIVHQGKQR